MLRILDGMGLTDIFHSWWFILLMGLVSLSIIAASIQRFPNAWRFYARPYKSSDETFRKALPTQAQIPISGDEAGLAAAERALRRMRISPERIVGENRFSLFAERNRISEMAVYIVHASLLLIFLGGIVDGLFGWRGTLTLNPGEQSTQVALQDGNIRHIPFSVRCDDAGQENYADGSPRKWWSKLAVVQEGREVLRKEIVVNDPLVYRGVRFYQSSYGPNGRVEQLILTATPSVGAGVARDISVAPGQAVALDENTTLRMAEFIPDYVVRDGQVYTRSAQVDNPAVHLLVESKLANKIVNVWLPPIPGFEQNASSPYQFEAKDLKMGHFTGLQVSHEPGQWAVWAGVVLMGFGLVVVFCVVHMRFWIVPVHNAQGQLVLWIGGAANKNKDVFEEKFHKLVQAIESEIKPAAAGAAARTASLVGN
jgi:cytochrome c biogenesis protein